MSMHIVLVMTIISSVLILILIRQYLFKYIYACRYLESKLEKGVKTSFTMLK